MVCFHNSITYCKSFNQPTNMANPLTLTEPSAASLRQTHQSHRNRKQPNPSKIPPCHRSRTAAIDVIILIAVIGACGFLIFPSMKLFWIEIVEIGGVTVSVVKAEIWRAPMVYASLGLSILFATLAAWGISKCWSRKCMNPNCRGLRKAVEFDIQLETEECVKNSSSSSLMKFSGGKGLLELTQDHHRELEAELRKIAPPNGRAVLEFRARCGCSVGRMEVPGPKKVRKIKK